MKRFFLIGLPLIAVSTAAAFEPHSVREPHYGEALFYYYQDRYLEAMTRIAAAEAAGRVETHRDDAELLLGGMLLSWGQHEDAAEVFGRLLEQSPRADLRDRAWAELARDAFRRGAYAEAEAALARLRGALAPDEAAETRLLRAQIHMHNGEHAAAVALLGEGTASTVRRAYADYNLGVALIHLGRLHEAEAALLRVGAAADAAAEAKAAVSEELMALADRARLSLGYALLDAGFPERAYDVLGGVSLDGPSSNRALLGAGWAASEMGRYREALTPWLELGRRDPLDPAVQESLLAVPYAFGELSAERQAVERYQEVIDLLEKERQRLEGAIAHAGGLLETLLSGEGAEPAAGRPLARLPDVDDARYLYHLVADHEFQTGLQSYRDLRVMRESLREWAQSVGVFEHLLETQRLALIERVPRVRAAMAGVDTEAFAARRAALARRLDEIERGRDVAALASPEESRQWQELEQAGQRLERLAGHPDAALLADKHRVLRGVLHWALDEAYDERLASLGRQLEEADEAAREAVVRAARVREAEQLAPDRLNDFDARIAALAPRIGVLQARVEAQLERQKAFLEQLAVTELEARRERLAGFVQHARFSLARILDQATIDVETVPEAGS